VGTQPEPTVQAAAAAPAETPAASGSRSIVGPATLDPGVLCSLEVDVGAGWVKRAELGCPPDGTVRIAAIGDVGWPGPTLDATVAGLLRTCRDAGGCHLLLIAGDLVYGPGANAEAVWNGVWDEALSRLGLIAVTVLGNHEYRHDPDPKLKRAVVFASDGRAGMVLPAANYAVRLLGPDGAVRLAVAALDTDTIVRQESLDPLREALAAACATGAPVLTVGHHPASSQGQHSASERPLEAAVRTLLLGAPEGCRLLAAFAGHDHDLQAWPPGCEQAGIPAVIVTGVAARGFRPPGDRHLTPCPVSGRSGAYHAGPHQAGGYALMTLSPDGTSTVQLFDTKTATPLSTLEF
jgi:hypothetical protein